MNGSTYSVSDVARLAHVTVRTLHHYDEIGLLRPRERTEAGYRLYGAPELERLQQILVLRELGLSLEAIGRTLDDPDYDREQALVEQKRLLEERIERMIDTLGSVESALGALQGNRPMANEDAFEGLGDFDPTEYEDEVRERWGESDAFRESSRRTKSYRKEDWARIKDEGERLVHDIGRLRDEGAHPTDAEAMDLAEAHRQHITRWFYTCSHATHRGLAEMYVADPRFTAYYDEHGEGLAAFFADAIRANAERTSG